MIAYRRLLYYESRPEPCKSSTAGSPHPYLHHDFPGLLNQADVSVVSTLLNGTTFVKYWPTLGGQDVC